MKEIQYIALYRIRDPKTTAAVQYHGTRSQRIYLRNSGCKCLLIVNLRLHSLRGWSAGGAQGGPVRWQPALQTDPAPEPPCSPPPLPTRPQTGTVR
jgi:hypothetical protein